MAVIPILFSDSRAAVNYKIRLARLATETAEQIERVKRCRAYYNGEHELLLSDDQRAFLRGVIDDDDSWPIDNKCRTVVRKIKGRLNVVGVKDPDGNRKTWEEAEGEPEESRQAAGGSEPARAGVQAAPRSVPGAPTLASAVALDGVGGGDVQPVLGGAVDAAVGWWSDNNLDRWEGELYKAALRDGEAYIITSHDGTMPVFTLGQMWDGDSGIVMIYEDPQTRQTPLVALKYWWTINPTNIDPGTGLAQGDDLAAAGHVLRVTVYTRNAVYKYAQFYNDRQAQFFKVMGAKTDDGFYPIADANDAAWPLPWVDGEGQPLGLAVTPFVIPDGSVIAPVLGLNNALNKTNVDLLSVGDQQGFALITVKYDTLPLVSDSDDDPTANDDGLGLRPGRALETTGDVTKLPADDMQGLLNLARHWVEGIAANSDVPLYEFLPLMGEVPSGAALQMLDSALAERAEECATSFTASWRDVLTLAQRLDNIYGDGVGEPVRLTPIWKDTTRRTIDAELAKLDLERRRLNLEGDRQGLQQRQAMAQAGGNAGIAARIEQMARGREGQ